MSGTFLVLSTFLAAIVESIEALTIVLATGITRGWRSALWGLGSGLAALILLILAFGPTISQLVPLDALRIVIGALLLIFGLQWLRKAILRAAGLKARHDEAATFAAERAAAEQAGAVGPGLDRYAFVISFKGVLLEGLEVVFIVLTFGANQHNVPLAAAAAAVAVLAVAGAGFAVHAPLSRVPENTMKFAV